MGADSLSRSVCGARPDAASQAEHGAGGEEPAAGGGLEREVQRLTAQIAAQPDGVPNEDEGGDHEDAADDERLSTPW